MAAFEELSIAAGTCQFGYRLLDGRGQNLGDTFPKVLVVLSEITAAGGFEITLRALEMRGALRLGQQLRLGPFVGIFAFVFFGQ